MLDTFVRESPDAYQNIYHWNTSVMSVEYLSMSVNILPWISQLVKNIQNILVRIYEKLIKEKTKYSLHGLK